MAWRRAVRLAALLVMTASAAGAVEPPALALPGPVSDLARTLGFDPAAPRAQVLIEIVRAAHAAPPGQSREADDIRGRLANWLRAGAATAAASPGGESNQMPLALDEARWTRLLPGRPRGPALAPAILLDRGAALLYVGLRGLDESSLVFFAERPGLLDAIYASHAAAFAAFSRSLRITDGRIVGLEANAAADWEAVAGVSPDDAEAFVLRLLSADRGRLAYFFDTLARLDQPRQRFATQAAVTDAAERRGGLRDLARVFERAAPEWRVPERPFTRPAINPALVLQQLVVDEAGHLAGPRATGFWTTVFDRAASRLDDDARSRDVLTRPLDVAPAWLLARLTEPDPDTRAARLRAVQFVQRLFPAPEAAALADVARAAEGAMRFPALALVLERIGVTDASMHARAASVAARLEASGARRVDLALFQGTLALIDRARFSGSLDAERATALCVSLLGAVPLDEARPGWIGVWLDGTLLPAVGGPLQSFEAAPGGAERRVLAALAGLVTDVPAPIVEWEGTSYTVDPRAAELRRLERVRSQQASVSLSGALVLDRLVRGLVGAASISGASLQAIEGVAAAEPSLPCGDWPPSGPPCETRALLREPLQRLTHHQGRQSPGRPEHQAVTQLARIADAALADAVVGLAYAVQLGRPDDAVTLAPDVARRHEFFATDQKSSAGESMPWTLPREVVSGGVRWHVRGAVLALEHALAPLLLPRPSAVGMPAPSKLPHAEVLALARSVARMRPGGVTDADRDWAAEVVARGRARVEAALSGGERASEMLPEAGWSQGRMNDLQWSLAFDPAEARRSFTLHDYFRLGLTATDRSDWLAPWGGSEALVAGALANGWPAGTPDEGVQRPAAGTVGGRAVDATLRVLEFLAAERLPAALAPALVALLAADLVWEAPLGSAHDWFAVASHATGLEAERLQDYVTSLTVDGPLVDADTGARGTDR